MNHKTLKATTTTTDRGEFSALAATYSVDRVNDRIAPGAFQKTIASWKSSGKQIPLHWDHEGSAANVIGFVDPKSMKETNDGLFVKGQLDLEDSEVAREAWRSMKNNAVSLSFGYLATEERKGKDGINELLEIDLFEISIVPGPANPDTRLLSLKNFDGAVVVEAEQETSPPVEDGPDEEPETVKSAPQDPLVQEAWELILRGAFGGSLPKHVPEPEPEPEPEPLNPAQVQREAWALLLKSK